MARKPLGEVMKGVPFAMTPLRPDGLALTALREGRLLPRDLALLWVLVSHMSPLTGRIWMNAAELAAAMGHRTPGVVLRSITRLKKAGLMAKGLDKREPWRWFYCVNPEEVACSGGYIKREMQLDQFAMASERLEPGRRRPPLPDQEPIAAA